jgi:nickel-dependent lactate racemase
MTASLRYGGDHVLEINLADNRLIAWRGILDVAPLADVRAATTAALDEPLGFPPLSQAVVPGDRVVLALDHDVPQGREIVAALFDCLAGRGLNPADITLLTTRAPQAATDLGERLLPVEYRKAATLAIHDPDVGDQLCYLAVGSDNEPIYLNRLLCDADVVVPIGCLRCEPAIDYHGLYGGLFPTFSGRAAQDKLFAAAGTRPNRDEARCREKIQEVGWLLGVQFTVQVVPGARGEALGVLAGKPDDVFSHGQADCQRAWASRVPRAANLVVAAIDGPAAEQTWDNVARAIAAALRVVSADGAIALCSDLAEPPGPTVRQAAEAKDQVHVLRQLRRRRLDDSLSAMALAEALAHARVYLISRLEDSIVEDLGITPLANPAELRRLAGLRSSCIVLSNAQYAVVTVEGE